MRIRSNIRSNILIAKNILLVIGTFTIALKIEQIAELSQKRIYVLNI